MSPLGRRLVGRTDIYGFASTITLALPVTPTMFVALPAVRPEATVPLAPKPVAWIAPGVKPVTVRLAPPVAFITPKSDTALTVTVGTTALIALNLTIT